MGLPDCVERPHKYYEKEKDGKAKKEPVHRTESIPARRSQAPVQRARGPERQGQGAARTRPGQEMQAGTRRRDRKGAAVRTARPHSKGLV